MVCSPVAGCLARAGRAVWVQSTSWIWAMPSHSNTHRIWRRAAAGTSKQISTSGERSRNQDLWLWSRAGTGRADLPDIATDPSCVCSSGLYVLRLQTKRNCLSFYLSFYWLLLCGSTAHRLSQPQNPAPDHPLTAIGERCWVISRPLPCSTLIGQNCEKGGFRLRSFTRIG